WSISGATYDLYTVAMHEIGHALGLYHSSVNTADMYSAYHGALSGLALDDKTGIQTIYGIGRTPDAYLGLNSTFLTASDLTSLIDPVALTGQTGYLNLTSSSQQEYFSVTAPAGTNGTFTVSAQSAGLSLLAPVLTVYAADQSTVLGTATVTGNQGGTATVTVNGVTVGTQYYIKVAGASSVAAFNTGRYGLALNFGSNPTPTIAAP